MSAIRQDAWTDDEDLLLAETVLRHIREGSTQLSAFEEVGKTLSRTPAACGFRWNSLIRKRYENAISLAKKQRKELNKKNKVGNKRKERPFIKLMDSSADHSDEQDLNLSQVIEFLKQLEQQSASRVTDEELALLKEENESLKQQAELLKRESEQLKKDFLMMKEDYQALIQIMDRARRYSEPSNIQSDNEWGEVTEALSVQSKKD
ncbi:RsfA family transcriptional regulator [Pullulanibacillus sp. KACC 23026]|uniref:RsfA family transcriptional regulator n=1 Tax=Pullulanibacillus sp. KACC 23026 TaxID=3028315 RepID=UPI0023B0D781|nr:RsfA family transcriptional regulator [Pullulanibacillus sp. KACC 23026]WEG11676.1 RsfA family transcriptional regulator [Pullulanibacillus sp. KACC 23026]